MSSSRQANLTLLSMTQLSVLVFGSFQCILNSTQYKEKGLIWMSEFLLQHDICAATLINPDSFWVTEDKHRHSPPFLLHLNVADSHDSFMNLGIFSRTLFWLRFFICGFVCFFFLIWHPGCMWASVFIKKSKQPKTLTITGGRLGQTLLVQNPRDSNKNFSSAISYW